MRLRPLENRLYARVRDPRAAELTKMEVRSGSPSVLGRGKYCLLRTFRNDGTPVDTPVWFGTDGERLYIRSGAEDGKVKRIRRDPRVLVAPCTARGKPLGDPVIGAARILPASDWPRAEAALRAHYGLGRK